MLEKLIEEIQELQKYKSKYECAEKDKAKMSKLLYDLMLNEYNKTSYEDRVKTYKEETCNHCRYHNYCKYAFDPLPQDINMPVESDKNFIPGRKTCGMFCWS